jgi:hypothetical protein
MPRDPSSTSGPSLVCRAARLAPALEGRLLFRTKWNIWSASEKYQLRPLTDIGDNQGLSC